MFTDSRVNATMSSLLRTASARRGTLKKLGVRQRTSKANILFESVCNSTDVRARTKYTGGSLVLINLGVISSAGVGQVSFVEENIDGCLN